MADQLIIEYYQQYETGLTDPTEKHILTEAIGILKESNNPEGFLKKLFTKLPYEHKQIRQVLREASKGKNKHIQITDIANTITD